MKQRTVVESAISDLVDYDWFQYYADDELVFVGDDEVSTAAKALKISPDAVDAIRNSLQFMANSIIEKLEIDLKDIYNKAAG